jgi:nitrite reductase/ring-hydroxylating ferredoxin subunit
MDRRVQKQLFAEINGYFETGSTKLADAELAHRATTYCDPAYFAREQAMMRTQPIVVGHAARLRAPGDFIAHEDTGAPILVVRQADGGLKAFFNVCRHRGARVCTAVSGNQRTFACPYHAWTYRADGSLLAAPKAGFPNLDATAHGLVELAVEERHGLVWVVATPGASIDVAAHLGALDAELASFPVADFTLERDTVVSEPINWKFVLDGFLEVYHIPVLHPESIAPWIHGKFSPFDTLGRHSRMLGIRKSFDAVRAGSFDDAEFLKHVAVNYQIFPNTILVWQGDHFEAWTSYPGRSVDTCIVRVQALARPQTIGEAFQKRWDRNWRLLLDTVTREDWAISREVQLSLPFVKDQQIWFGRNEPGLQHFHTVLDQSLEGD